MAEYNPNKQGWVSAGIVVAMTGALLFTAYTIHTNTYRHPRDPMNTQVYHDRDITGGEHGAANTGDHGDNSAEQAKGQAAKPASH